jgi:murein tripeptide amidase MpaA
MSNQFKPADFARYYKYDEYVTDLRRLIQAYPNLIEMYSIGKSYEGRDIWAVELTNRSTGAAADKPGFYIDANIHAGEVTGCATAMYTIAFC